MADKKISALPASTTPLAGTEVLPIVQSGATTQVSVANLTAGRALSATSIQFGSGTALSSYETGTWTPALLFDSGQVGSFTYTTQTGTYTKVGRLVTARFNLAWSARPSAGVIMVIALPFTAVNAGNVQGFISAQGGITNIGYSAIIGGDGLVITSYVSTECAIATVKSGAAYTDPLGQTALTSASGSLAGEIIYEVS